MLKTAVIGVGHLGSSHARVYKRLDCCDLTGILDTDEVKAVQIADGLAVKAFGSIDDVLENCDALSIATTTTSHYEIAIKAIEAGKHVLIEKPVTTTVMDAEKLIIAAQDKDVRLQVGHIERFNPALTAVLKYIDKPLFIESHRLSSFGGRGIEVDVILDLMIHDIDIILNLAGEEPSEIRCAGAPVLTDTSDIANVRLEFASGLTANVTASRISTNPMRKMRIFQKAGYISIDFAERKPEVYLLDDDRSKRDSDSIFSFPSGVKGKSIHIYKPEVMDTDMLEDEIRSFIESIQNDTSPVVDGQAGLKALKVATRIIEHLPAIPSDI